MASGVGPRRRRALLLGLASAVALFAPPALARQSRVGFMGGAVAERGQFRGSVLSQDELERCVMLEREVNAEAAAIDAAEAAMAARKDEIESLRQEVERHVTRVDRNSQDSINRHNRMAERQRSQASEFNAGLPDFNARVARHHARAGQFNANCAVKPYVEADMRTVRKRLLLD